MDERKNHGKLTRARLMEENRRLTLELGRAAVRAGLFCRLQPGGPFKVMEFGVDGIIMPLAGGGDDVECGFDVTWVGRSVFDVVPFVGLEQFKAAFVGAVSGARDVEYEAPVPDARGTLVMRRHYLLPVVMDNMTRALLLVVGGECRTGGPEKIKTETEQLLETIFDYTHILIAYLDTGFNYIKVNRAYAEADGRNASFFPGLNLFYLYPDDGLREIFEQVLEGGAPYFASAMPLENYPYVAHGVTFWDWSLIPVRKAGGPVVGLLLTLTDVTESVRARMDLQESETRFRSIFEYAVDGIYIVDQETKRTVMANAVFCRMMGYTNEALGRIGVEDIHPAEHLPTIVEVFRRQAAGEFTLARDIPMKRKDGTIFYADINSTSIRLGSKDCMMGFFRDVSYRRQQQEGLEASLREKEALLAKLKTKK